MFNIKTVTMKFDPLEDRIIMDCCDKSKKTQRLWLTRRLLDRLIPSLTDQLEVNSINKISKELEQSFAQEKAEKNKPKTETVHLKKNNPSWLVTSIKVEKDDRKFKLVFIDQRNLDNKNNYKSINNAQFILAISNLRQWLNAFYKIYKKALWDTEIFPNWMKDKEQVLKTKILLN